MKIDILGTKYDVQVEEQMKNTSSDGVCKLYDKTIRYRAVLDMLNAEDGFNAKETRYEEVIRHEIVHAFFYEAGLHNYCSNEELVDWLAIQFPKMVKAMIKAGGLTNVRG